MKTTSEIVVRYQETDQMGITHHSVYPVWYEVARTDFIKSFGITYSEMEKMGILLPVTGVTSNYFNVSHYEDVLQVETKVIALSAARITFGYTVLRDGLVLNTGTTSHGWVGADFRPINMKKKHPDLYQKLYQAMKEEEENG